MADKLDRGRARNANKLVIQEYFELLEKTLIENNIRDKSDRIYNCDETGMVLDSNNDQVIAQRGAKHVYSQSMGTREHITVHACACANGTMLPPVIIFAKGFPGGAYTRGGPTNALYVVVCVLLRNWMSATFRESSPSVQSHSPVPQSSPIVQSRVQSNE